MTSTAIPGVEVHRFATSGPLPPRRVVGAFSIGTVIHGDMKVYCARAFHSLDPGAVWCAHPDLVIGAERLRSSSFESVEILVDPEELRAEGAWPRFLVMRHDGLASLVLDLACAIEARAPEAEQLTAYVALLSGVLPRALIAEPEPPRDARIQKVSDALRTRYAEKLTLEDLRVVSGLSRFQMVRIFTAEIGLPPHAFHLAIRVERARALLRSGRPLVEVARAVGYSDLSHFCRHFKRWAGMTPGEYARRVAAGVRA